MWDAFSCAFPVLTSQPNMPKSFYKIVWADVNWLWWNREFSSDIIPWDIIEFEIVIRNIGKLPLLNTRFYDNIPAWSSYILWTSKVNGIILSDTGWTSPFVSWALIQSPNAITWRVLVDTTPNIIDREAVIQLRVRIDNPATTLRISNIWRLTAEDISQTYTYDPNGSWSNSFSDVIFEQLPIAVDDYYFTTLNTPVDLNPLSGDIWENTWPLSITKINGIDLTPGIAQSITVPNGSVEISSTGIITYIPTTWFIGTTSFPYTVSSTLWETRTAYEFITVPNTAPVAITDMYTWAWNSAITLNPLSGDYDTDNHTLTIISINWETLLTWLLQLIAVSWWVVTVWTSWIITFTPNFGFTGIISFPYVISDGYWWTGTANQIINLSNQDPIAIDDNYSTTVNTPIWLNPLSWDSDPDWNNLIISSINGVTLTLV